MIDIVISSPLRGQWAIMNAPGHADLAYDFLAVNTKKNPYRSLLLIPHLLAYISVNSTFAWSQAVFAPFSGEVIEIFDGQADRLKINMLKDLMVSSFKRPDSDAAFNHFGGNYLIIKSLDGDFFTLLAHLKSGSILVKDGDNVIEGQKLGEVGNSGTSIQPHLHFQIMKSRDPFPINENLLIFKFKEFHIRRSDKWIFKQLATINNGDHLYF